MLEACRVPPHVSRRRRLPGWFLVLQPHPSASPFQIFLQVSSHAVHLLPVHLSLAFTFLSAFKAHFQQHLFWEPRTPPCPQARTGLSRASTARCPRFCHCGGHMLELPPCWPVPFTGQGAPQAHLAAAGAMAAAAPHPGLVQSQAPAVGRQRRGTAAGLREGSRRLGLTLAGLTSPSGLALGLDGSGKPGSHPSSPENQPLQEEPSRRTVSGGCAQCLPIPAKV